MTEAAAPTTPPSTTDRLSLFVLSFFGLGFLPLVPGTFGTLGGVLVALALPADHWHLAVAAAIVISSALTVVLGKAAARVAGRKDPQSVVMDEVAGFLVTVLVVPDPTMLEMGMAFLLFRVFDLLKPFPARKLEKLPDGWGVLLDDIAAGVYAALALLAVGALWPLR